jgi:hypothetical protein
MIRRGFWVTVGAVGGIMAYRRVAAFGRRASGTLGAGRDRVTTLGVARETIRFTRDVRDGMDEYMARHPGQPGPTLGANKDHTEKDDR